MPEKPIFFLGSSLDDLREFPANARREAGYELSKIQVGERPSDFKPMQIVGAGVYEIRIRDEGQAFRVFYVARFEDAVYVLHAFEKKTQTTPQRDIDLAKSRYNELLRRKREEKQGRRTFGDDTSSYTSEQAR